MVQHHKKIGLILAGGESRRFGEPKAFSIYRDRAMVEWTMDALKPFVDETIVLSHPSLFQRFKKEWLIPIFKDEEKYCGMGPLAGIYTAMVKCPAAWYYVIPCDMPLITPETFQLLSDHLQESDRYGIVPIVDGRLQPLVAIYHRKLLPIIHSLLSRRLLKMKDFIECVPILKYKVEETLVTQFININTKGELQTLKNQNG